MSLLDKLRENPAYAEFDDMEVAGAIRQLKPEYQVFSENEVYEVISAPGSEEMIGGLYGPQIADDRWEITKGVASGIDLTQGLAGGVVAMAGDAAGSDSMRKYGMEVYSRNMAEAQANSPRVNRIEDIESVGDFTDWAMGTIGQLAPTMAAMIAAGGVGGLLAKQAAKRSIGNYVKRNAGKAISQKAKARLLQRAVAKGQVGGAAAGSIGMETGGIYGDVASDGFEGAKAILASIAGGTVAGSLDVLPVVRLAKRVGLAGGLTKALKSKYAEMGMGKRVASMSATQAGFEAVTEGLQTLIEEATKSFITNENLPDDLASQFWNAVAAGAVGGAVFGSVGGVPRPRVMQGRNVAVSERDDASDEVYESELQQQDIPVDEVASAPPIGDVAFPARKVAMGGQEPVAVADARDGEPADTSMNAKPEARVVSEDVIEGDVPDALAPEPPIIVNDSEQDQAPPSSGAFSFTPTHVSVDGEALMATDEPNLFLDADGMEVEDAGAQVVDKGRNAAPVLAVEERDGQVVMRGGDPFINRAMAEGVLRRYPGYAVKGVDSGFVLVKEDDGAPAGQIGEGAVTEKVGNFKEVNVDRVAHEAATSPKNSLPEPSQLQKDAGNYKKGHVTLHGLDVAIENPKGSVRSGIDSDGQAWSQTMQSHYGYIKRSVGKDGDQVDVFLGREAGKEGFPVFVVDQIDPKTGRFDEHKVMIGFKGLRGARKAYLANYEKGWKGIGGISKMSMDEFKTWLREGDTTKPAVMAKSQNVEVIKAKNGKPFRRYGSAKRALKLYPGREIEEVDGGFVLKKKGEVKEKDRVDHDLEALNSGLEMSPDEYVEFRRRTQPGRDDAEAEYQAKKLAGDANVAELIQPLKPLNMESPLWKKLTDDQRSRIFSKRKEMEEIYEYDPKSEYLKVLADEINAIAAPPKKQKSTGSPVLDALGDKPQMVEKQGEEKKKAVSGKSGAEKVGNKLTDNAVLKSEKEDVKNVRRDNQTSNAGDEPGAVSEAQTGRESGVVAERAGRVRAGSDGSEYTQSKKGKRRQAGSGGHSAEGTERRKKGSGRGRPAKRVRADKEPGLEFSFPARNYRIGPDDALGQGGAKTKARQNLEAIRILKTLEAEGRTATPDEQVKLVKYVGWGASELANGMFPTKGKVKKGWKDLSAELRELLTQEEWKQASRTTQYAHYTPPEVISGIYDGLVRMGFEGGVVMEPGMGVGHFVGLMPADMAARSHYTGIEYDAITAGIAKHLYPESNIQHADFTRYDVPPNHFDLVIGNPPFSSAVIQSDPRYKKQRFSLHEYFFAKSIDSLRPGGIQVFVTSRYLMDRKGERARQYLMDRADLLGAVRLPQTAFKANAGTEVVTDILFFRKRADGEPAGGVSWDGLREIQTPEGQAVINEYFVEHPEMVLGEHALTGSMYGKDEYTVNPAGGIEKALPAAVARLPEAVYQSGESSEQMMAAQTAADFDVAKRKRGAFYLESGKLMQVQAGGMGRPVKVKSGGRGEGLYKNQAALIMDLVPLKEAAMALLDAQVQGKDFDALQAELNRRYDAFVAKHGAVNKVAFRSRKNRAGEQTEYEVSPNFPKALLQDPDAILLVTLDSHDPVTGGVRKGAILTERILEPERPPKIETAPDALAAVLNSMGRVDIAAIAEQIGMSEADAVESLGDLLYRNPVSQEWETRDEYLSGHVRDKLHEARVAAEGDVAYQRNVDALEQVQPADIPPSQITARLGASWVPASDVELFAREVLGLDADINYSLAGRFWALESSEVLDPDLAAQFGTQRRDAEELLSAGLNQQQVNVYDLVREDGKDKQVLNTEQTELARSKLMDIKAAFERWIWQDGERAERLARHYNDRFNDLVPRRFDGSHLTLPGVTTKFKLRPHQKRVVWRIIQSGNTYMAHTVGAGKTMASIAAGMEQKRLGMIRKPMYVVPNHMLKQFATEFLELYPAAKILVADEENFYTKVRAEFVARSATENWDGVVITHSAFGLIKAPSDFEKTMLDAELQRYKEALEDVPGDQRATRKRMEKLVENMEQRLSAVQGRKQDDGVSFEQLGVDMLFVDEAHEFRKLSFATSQGNVKGIDPSGSQKAWDMYVKSQYLDAMRPGRSLVLMSGTPVTNTMGEMFTLQRFLQRKELERKGLDDFDSWSGQFADTLAVTEQTPSGGYKVVTRLARFVNVPELLRMFRDVADVVRAADLDGYVVRPVVKGGSMELVTAEPTEAMRAYQGVLARRMTAIENRKGPPKKGDDILLTVITDGRHAALDDRYIDPSLDSNPGTKLNLMIDRVYEVWRDTKDRVYHDRDTGEPESALGSTQMIFADLGVSADRGFSAYDAIKQELVARGVPADEVAYIRDYKKATQKLKLFADLNSGRKRILIGSSRAMGTGVNAQQRLYALHHLDAPWYPADMEQRRGRMVRQGNKNKEVLEIGYAAKGTYDSTMFTMLETKQRFIDQMWSDDFSVREMDDLAGDADQYALAKALSSGDERLIQKVGLEQDVARLQRLRNAHADEQVSARARMAKAESSIKTLKKLVGKAESELAKRVDTMGDAFSAVIDGEIYDDRKEAGQALMAIAERLMDAASPNALSHGVGKLAGYEVSLHIPGRSINDSGMPGKRYGPAEINLELTGVGSIGVKSGQSPLGLVQRLENQARKIEDRVAGWEDDIKRVDMQRKRAKAVLGKPFDHESEFKDVMEKLAALDRALLDDVSKVGAEGDPAFSIGPLGFLRDVERLNDGRDLGALARGGFGKATTGGAIFEKKAVEAIVERITSRMRFRAPIHVHATEAALFEAVPEIEQQADAQDAAGNIKAVFFKGKVHVVSSNMRSEVEIEEALLHEAFGHFGFRRLFSGRLKQAADELYTRIGGMEGARKVAEQYGVENKMAEYFSYAEKLPRHRQAFFLMDELVAHLQGGQVYASLGQRIKQAIAAYIGAVRQWLRDMGLVKLSGFSDADLMYLLARVKRAAKDGGYGQDGDALFSIGYGRGVRLYEVPRKTAKWMGFDRFRLTVNYSELQSRHPEHYASDDAVRRDVEFVFGKPDDWYPHANGRVVLFRQGRGRTPAVRVDFRRGGDGIFRIVSVYPISKRSIARKMKGKKDALSRAGSTVSRISEGVLLPEQLSIADYLMVTGDRSSLPASSSENALKDPSDGNIGDMADDGKPVFSLQAVDKAVQSRRKLLLDRAKDWFSDVHATAYGGLLGGLTFRQLAEVGGDKLPHLKGMVGAMQKMQTARNQMADESVKLSRQWLKLPADVAQALADMMHNATIAEVDPSIPYKPVVDIKDALKRVKRIRYLKQTHPGGSGQIEVVWNREMRELLGKVKKERARKAAYAGLKRQWDALPSDAQSIYMDARDAYMVMSRRMEEAIVARIDAANMDKRVKTSAKMQVRMDFEKARLEAPYFPLQRFGRFYVVAVRTDENGNKDHAFFMFDNASQRRRGLREIRDEGWKVVRQGVKSELAKDMNAVSEGFVADAVQSLRDKLGPVLGDEASDVLYQSFLGTMPFLSNRVRYIHRKKTPGYSGDALRAFGFNMAHQAIQVARMEAQPDLSRLMDNMDGFIKDSAKELPDGDVTKLEALAEEAHRRYEWLMNPQGAPWAAMATTAGFIWYLGLSPAAALVNLSQTAVVAFPELGARFGAVKAFSALRTAMIEVIAARRNWKRRGDYSQWRRLSKDERDAFKIWHDAGEIDVTQTHMLLGLAESESVNYNPKAARAIELTGVLFQEAEVVNREATLLAGYRLARANGASHDEAVKVSQDATWNSHFDYSNANRARWMQSNMAKVLLLFRSYSQHMTYYLWRNFYQSMRGESTEVKIHARKRLMGVLGMTGLFAGSLGMPLMGVMFAIANATATMFGDDDEPWDAETEWRNFLADYGAVGQIADRGVMNYLTGADVSSRTSLDNLWFRDPDRDLEGKALYNYWLEQIVGPLGGIAANIFRAVDLAGDGKVERALEAATPKAVRDGLKMIRYADEGVLNFRGDPVVPKAAMTPLDLALQGIGFTPDKVAAQWDANRQAKLYEQRLDIRRRNLVAAYALAYMDNDRSGMREALRKIRAWNNKHRWLRIDKDTLRQSIRMRRRYSRTADAGIHLRPSVRYLRDETRVGGV